MYEHGSIILTPDGQQRIWKNFHRDGKLIWEGSYLGKERDGYSRWFFYTGIIFCEGHFINGNKTGRWIFYNPDGSINREYVHFT